MNKVLKLYNGRGQGTGEYKRGCVYIAAYSQKQAAEMICKAFNTYVTLNEIQNYFHFGSWGDPMKNIIPENPCIYASKTYKDKPELILSLDKEK